MKPLTLPPDLARLLDEWRAYRLGCRMTSTMSDHETDRMAHWIAVALDRATRPRARRARP